MNAKQPNSSQPPSPRRLPLGQLLDRTEAASYLGVTLKFMTRYRGHNIPHVHVGRYLKFPEAWLERWLLVGTNTGFVCPKAGCTLPKFRDTSGKHAA